MSLDINNEEIEVETTTSKRNVFFWSMYDLANTIYRLFRTQMDRRILQNL